MDKLIAYKLLIADKHITAKKIHGAYAVASIYDRIKK